MKTYVRVKQNPFKRENFGDVWENSLALLSTNLCCSKSKTILVFFVVRYSTIITYAIVLT